MGDIGGGFKIENVKFDFFLNDLFQANKREGASMEKLKTTEQRLRRRLKRRGYSLSKSRFREPLISGYMILQDNPFRLIAGQNYSLSLNDVEKFIKKNDIE